MAKIDKDYMAEKRHSAWDRGVNAMCEAILSHFTEAEDITHDSIIHGVLRNGASDWSAYSYGGCALVYDSDIAKMFCTPSELRRKRGGELPPNGRETWLDVQARGLRHAARLIRQTVRAHEDEGK